MNYRVDTSRCDVVVSVDVIVCHLALISKDDFTLIHI